jgi:hypothetical protein
MTKRIFIFLAMAVMVSACGAPVAATATSTLPPTSTPKIQPTEKPLPTVTPACISPDPTQEDIDRAFAYTGDVFTTPDWEQSYTPAGNRVSVTWLNNPSGAVAYLEAIIFPCGYDEPDLNNYYSDENWKTIFQYYENYELVDECKRSDGLRLYEFKTQNQGFEYGVKYWVKNDTDTRVISMMIVFPLELESTIDDYSIRLFPTYPSCP